MLNLLNSFNIIDPFIPLFIGFYAVSTTLINQNVKGLIFLAGSIIATIINLSISYAIKNPIVTDVAGKGIQNAICRLSMPFNSNFYNIPSFNSMFISFTLTYLIACMTQKNMMNYYLIAGIVVMFIIDGFVQVNAMCTQLIGILLGLLVGIILGYGWFAAFNFTGNNKLLYFSDTPTTGEKCKVEGNKAFKCSVYKNGELIG